MRFICPLFFLVISACSKPVNSPKPTVSIVSQAYVTPILIYLTPEESMLPSLIINEAKRLIPKFRNSKVIPDSIRFDGFKVDVLAEGDDGFVSPSTTLMLNTFLNMSDEETDRFSKAKQAVAIYFFGTKDQVIDKQSSICNFIYALVKDKKVI